MPTATPLPEYFQSRPSAAGDGYDGGASSGSQLGPENADLIAAIEERQAADRRVRGRRRSPTSPPTRSPRRPRASTRTSAPRTRCCRSTRVAAARGPARATVRELVESRIQARDLGFLGEPRVNVLELNLALDALQG